MKIYENKCNIEFNRKLLHEISNYFLTIIAKL